MAWASARIEKTPHPPVIPTEERSDEWRDLLSMRNPQIVETRPLGYARGDGY
jgi:hypothetical protein